MTDREQPASAPAAAPPIVPAKRPAYEPPARLLKPIARDPHMRRPASVTAGAAGVKVMGNMPEADWKNPLLTCYFSTPVADGKGHLFMITGVASLTNPSVTLRCVEAATGKELWKHYYWFSWIESPPVVRGQTVYTGSSDGVGVYAIDVATGARRWKAPVPGWAWARTAVDDRMRHVSQCPPQLVGRHTCGPSLCSNQGILAEPDVSDLDLGEVVCQFLTDARY